MKAARQIDFYCPQNRIFGNTLTVSAQRCHITVVTHDTYHKHQNKDVIIIHGCFHLVALIFFKVKWQVKPNTSPFTLY